MTKYEILEQEYKKAQSELEVTADKAVKEMSHGSKDYSVYVDAVVAASDRVSYLFGQLKAYRELAA